jgi:hypothetical protein
VPTTLRERISDRLLETGIRLGTERELMARSLQAAARSRADFERAAGYLLLAGWVDTSLIRVSVWLRPESARRQPAGSS